MPLALPPGVIARPVISGSDVALSGARVTTYRFDVLDNDENLLGTARSVQPGGSVSWDVTAAIKGGGSITVTDLGQNIDWLNVRIRPMAVLSRAGGGDDPAGTTAACGVFIPSAPVENWSATGREWKVELLDKCSVLDQDIPTDADGSPVAYTAPVGTNVVAAVIALIQSAGEATPAIGPGPGELSSALVWDMGTTKLKIINDLLAAASYLSLWCDGQGQYQVTSYVPPSQRPVVYDLMAPFTKGPTSLMAPTFTRDRDIYSIPNRYVVVGQRDGEDTSPVLGDGMAVATNEDPASPYSFAARGRWITTVETGVESASQDDLTVYAQRQLANAMAVTSTLTVGHIFLPDIRVNAVVRFVNGDASMDTLCTVTNTTIPFDPVALAQSTMQEVTA